MDQLAFFFHISYIRCYIVALAKILCLSFFLNFLLNIILT